jgi:hypothetical protein
MGMGRKKFLSPNRGLKSWICKSPNAPSLKRGKVKFTDCTACYIKRIEAWKDLFWPGSFFLRLRCSVPDGVVALLGKVHDDGDDRSAPVKEFPFFLIFLPFDTPLSIQSFYRVATCKPIMLIAMKITDELEATAHMIQYWWVQGW